MKHFYFLLFTFFALNLSFGQTAVFINEIHYDDAGSDSGEGVEIAGPSGTSLTSYTITAYNGNNGESYKTETLSGTIPDLNSTGYGTVFFPISGLQNGSPDGVALDSDGTLIQFLSYEGVFAAINGVASGVTSTDIGVAETGSTPDGESLQLTGSGTTYENFTWSVPLTNTYDAINTGQTFGAATPAITISSPSNSAVLSPGTSSVSLEWNTNNLSGSETVDVVVNGNTEQNATSPFSITTEDGQTYTVTVNLIDGGTTVASDNISFSVGNMTQVADIAALRQDVVSNGLGNFYEITGECFVNQTDGYNNRRWVQDSNNSGILIYDSEDVITTDYTIGDAVTGLQGYTAEVYGVLRFIPTSDSGVIASSNNTITPQLVSISDLNSDPDVYESTLVRIAGSVEFTDADGSTLFSNGSNYTITDGAVNSEDVAITGNVRTEFYGVFNQTIIPSDLQLVTGVAGQYNGTAQVYPRTLSDIEADSCYFKEGFTHGFDTVVDGFIADASCWLTFNGGGTAESWGIYSDTTAGGYYWGMVYPATFNADWLISPAFKVADNLTDGVSVEIWENSSTYPEAFDIVLWDVNLNQIIATLAVDPETSVAPQRTTLTYDLSDYEGQNLRFAIYNYSAAPDGFYLWVDNFQLTSFSSLGTNNPDQSTTFEYFPNPVKDELTVKAQQNIDSIEIFNILGQSVISLIPGALETKVDMQTLQTGAYFVKISINQKTEIFRVLKN